MATVSGGTLHPAPGSLGVLRRYAAGPAVWTRFDLHDTSSWSCAFTAAELVELARHVAGQEAPSPAFSSTVAAVRAHLFAGLGFTVVRGLDADAFDAAALHRVLLVLGARLGEIVPQNVDGDTVRCVTDMTEGAERDRSTEVARGHRGRAAMHPHSDSADVVALLCVRGARCGGASRVVSSMAVYNEMLRTRPELVDILCAGFQFDLAGKTRTELAVSDRIPVFRSEHGQLSCTFNKARIEAGMRKVGALLDDTQRMAIDHMNELAMSDEFSIRFVLRPGEILFLNNHVTLHGRDEYEDWPEPSRRRLLLRLWLNGCESENDL